MDRHVEFIHDVLISIHENLSELQQRKNFAEPEELGYIEAKIMAYQEVLAILKMSADEFKIPRQELGL
ncbi:MAG TPA: hypothetical protein VL443_20835 [Cyclobacteriaceae bacterium]|jgi:hypothetical protein|nr:hypothetical protein [Cyclobacteriaceae bacterium]